VKCNNKHDDRITTGLTNRNTSAYANRH